MPSPQEQGMILTSAATTLALLAALTPATGDYAVTIHLVDRAGTRLTTTAAPTIAVFKVGDPSAQQIVRPGRIRLPRGRYALHATIETARAGQESSYSFISHPELRVVGDRTVTLDARVGKSVGISTDNPRADGGTYAFTRYTGTQAFFQELNLGFHPVFAATVPGTSSSTFAYSQYLRATDPQLRLKVRGPDGFGVEVFGFLNSPRPEVRGTTQAVFGGAGTTADLAKIDARGKLVLLQLPPGTTYVEAYARTENVKRAGAKLAMIVATGRQPARARRAADEPGPALPTLEGQSVTARRFAALVKRGERTVDFEFGIVPTLRYELSYAGSGALTTSQVHHAKTADLARVRTTYHDNAAIALRELSARSTVLGESAGIFDSLPAKAPTTRTEYFTPGTWRLSACGPGPSCTYATRVLHKGDNTPVAWNKAVAGPSFRGTVADREYGTRPFAWRKNGRLDVVLPMFGDSSGEPREPMVEIGTDSGRISLSRNGAPPVTEPSPVRAAFEVPAGAATYKVSAEAKRSASWWPLWTKVSADWTFRSSGSDEGKALPLLTIRLDPSVDVRNRAPASREQVIPAYAERAGVPVNATSLTVQASNDDGQTWHAARVTKSEDGWRIVVRNPAQGHVSLRATASDAAGNGVVQTVIRAYEIQ